MNDYAADLAEILADLHRGAAPVVWLPPEAGRWLREPPEPPRGILAGSFNPLHEGHVALRLAAEAFLGGAVYLELTLRNADKPLLDEAEVRRRLGPLRGHPLAVTGAATFAEKARLFRGVTFVVGIDTAARILQPRFYDDCRELMASSLAEIRSAGCRFLVAGRADQPAVGARGRFRALSDLSLPADFADLFIELPEADFRADVSSTALRDGG